MVGKCSFILQETFNLCILLHNNNYKYVCKDDEKVKVFWTHCKYIYQNRKPMRWLIHEWILSFWLIPIMNHHCGLYTYVATVQSCNTANSCSFFIPAWSCVCYYILIGSIASFCRFPFQKAHSIQCSSKSECSEWL